MNTQLLVSVLLLMKCNAEDYFYHGFNVSRTTLSPVVAYRSSLTLDWLAAADTRQRAVADMYETDEGRGGVVNTECIAYPRPSPGKIGRHMLDLLKNLEGDHGTLIQDLIQSLIRSKILVETSAYEAEPNLLSLVQTPEIMMGEPHVTFPRILSLVWMSVTDPSSVRKHGWCPISKVSQFLLTLKPSEIARHMRALDLVMDRARYVMEDFIHHITPVTVYEQKSPRRKTPLKGVRERLPKEPTEPTVKGLQLVDTTTSSTKEWILKPVGRNGFYKFNAGVKTSPGILTIACMYSFIQ